MTQDEIREQMERDFHRGLDGVFLRTITGDTETLLAIPPDTRKEIWDIALAIKVGENRKCPLCNGTAKRTYCIDDTARRQVEEACTYCKASGKLPAKSLGDIIKEALG